ncbi:MAG TPA: NBR1-Ig-like domain-containing protein, partial [Anaerolineales bacterium]|nr:NBR1-Ig-like domain-containing protein [Anaerolineales bacterium]
MKSRLQAVSTLLLVALVLSFIPAAALPSSASAAQTCTDRAQFVTDVTVPDGTRYDTNVAFTKTWRLRNIGTCTWTTAYTMVFVDGTQMASTNSVAFPSSVPPGQTVDLSVNMTSPIYPGHYIGYWKFKNANGVIFGIGVNANRAWWVEINVETLTTGVAYDFTANAGSATWSSGAGGLTFPGTNGDPKGFASKLDKPTFESGATLSQPGLLFSPQQITNGFIQAVYPDFAVQSGDRFQTTVGCQINATSCYVAYRLDYQVGSTIRTFWTFRERYEGLTFSPSLDLTPLAGQTVKFILYISAWGSPVGDLALWGNPVIVRKGVTPPPTVTGTPPTATPTNTPGPTPATVPPSACDRAQFIADVNVPDGTVMAPGATFTKTWSIKNVGACAWNTSYQLVFFSGERMNGPTALVFSQNVAVGQTFKFSVNLTAPSAAGSYRGFWMFKNANGQLFGIGPQGNKPWWVDIKVSGPTVTPGGP